MALNDIFARLYATLMILGWYLHVLWLILPAVRSTYLQF